MRSQFVVVTKGQFYNFRSCEKSQVLPFTLVAQSVFAETAKADEEG